MNKNLFLTANLSEYFSYNSLGQLCINYADGYRKTIPIVDFLHQANFQGATYPLVLYFEHILKNKIDKLYNSFEKAISNLGYTGKYSLAYPIKVNPEQKIIKAIYDYHQHNQVSLDYEVGTKSELLAVLSTAAKTQKIICNGFKDLSFYKIAQLAAKIGYKIIIVIENISEINIIQDLLDNNVNIKFDFGIRTKPFDNCIHTQKFGLSLSQINECINFLKTNQLQQKLALLHSHIGSQLKSTDKVVANIQRLMRIYSELKSDFVNLEYIDFGGGLAVNYDEYDRPSYDFDSYAKTIIKNCKYYAEYYNCDMPSIVTESGRAITAESSLLITRPLIKQHESDIENEILHQQWLDREVSLGELQSYLPQNQKKTQQAWLNFSIFQSLPDHWGIDQKFPILPLEFFNSYVTSEVKLYDISCDVDGVIKSTSEYIEIATDNIEYIVFMCVGAYQGMLSAKHNMLGNISAVNIYIDENRKVKVSVKAAENYYSLLDQYGYNSLRIQSNLKRYYYYHQEEINQEEEEFLDNLFIDNPYMGETTSQQGGINYAIMAG